MSFWMPLKKRKNAPGTNTMGGFELSPEVTWKLYTLAEGLSSTGSTSAFSPPGIYTGTQNATLFPERLERKGLLLLPKLDFKNFPFLLFVVSNGLSVTQEVSGANGGLYYPFLSYFDRRKLTYSTHVNCGVFTSRNITLTPSLQRRRFSCNFTNYYS